MASRKTPNPDKSHPQIPPEKIEQIRTAFVETGGNVKQTCDRCECHHSTVTRYTGDLVERARRQREKIVYKDDLTKAMEEADRDRERQGHREAVKELSFRQFLGKLIREVAEPMPAQPPSPARPVTPNAHERFPHLLLTDWHFEESVKPEGVMHLNAYGIETSCRRLYRVIQAAKAWKRDMEAAGRFHIPELTVALNGDLLTGTLHGLERHSDSPNIVRSALACGDLIALALADLRQDFPRLRVIGVVGNHGRLPDDKKVPTKDPTRSWDYLAYGIAQRRLANDPAIEWHLPDAYGTLYEMAGHLTYQAHGNFIPQSLGIIGYGIRRFASALGANLSATGKPLRYAFFGHWHSQNAAEFAGITAFVGPSLIGTQEYMFLSGGAVSRSAQQLTVFDKELGHVSTEMLYGEGKGYDGTYKVNV